MTIKLLRQIVVDRLRNIPYAYTALITLPAKKAGGLTSEAYITVTLQHHPSRWIPILKAGSVLSFSDCATTGVYKTHRLSKRLDVLEQEVLELIKEINDESFKG